MLTEKRAAALRVREERKLANLQALAADGPQLTEAEWAEVRAIGVRVPLKDRHSHKQANWRHQAAKRHASKLQRTPPWADLEAIRALHAEAQRRSRETGTPHHVDHVIPLQGATVSGLHVHTNMQILTGSENSRKWNRFEP